MKCKIHASDFRKSHRICQSEKRILENLLRTIVRVTLGYFKTFIFQPFDVLIIQCTQIEVQESHTVTEKERKKEGKNDIDGNRREQQNLL